MRVTPCKACGSESIIITGLGRVCAECKVVQGRPKKSRR